MSRRKSFKILPLLLLIGGVVLGAAFGFMFAAQMDDLSAAWGMTSPLPAMALMLLGLYVVVQLQAVIHEGGHLIFGLLTGYRFVSFRIGSLMLLRTEQGLKLKRFSLAGTGGQCLLSPPGTLGENMPFMLYHFGGVIMNLLTALVSLILCFSLRSVPFLSLMLLSSGVFGLFLAITNGVPMKGIVNNDGHNALSMRRDSAARRSMWIQLMGNAMLAQGKNVLDMPEEWFILPDNKQLLNSVIAPLAPLRSDYLMAQRRFTEAAALQDHLLSINTALVPVHRTLLTCDRIYCEVMTSADENRIAELMTREYRKQIAALKGLLPAMRTEYALALLANDLTKADKALQRFERRARSYPYAAEVKNERELMQLARQHYAAQTASV